MSASSMFSNLSKEQCEAVIGAMYPAQRKAGDPVIVQGEPAQVRRVGYRGGALRSRRQRFSDSAPLAASCRA